MQVVDHRHLMRRAAVGAILALLLVAELATPALADPAATSWTVNPESKIVTYGQGVVLNGVLRSGDVALGALWVDFAQATTEAGSYEVVYRVTTSQAGYATGTYSVAVMPLQTMYYRFQWAGDATFAAGDSDVIPVQVKPSLGAPGGSSSVNVGKKLTVKGSVKPGAPSGPAVKIKAYRQKGNGTWVGYKTYASKISGTQYSQAIKITQAGKFKFKAVSVASAEYAAGESGYGKVTTVKK
jgi:hypothetical protein